jgi:hypothetical protein
MRDDVLGVRYHIQCKQCAGKQYFNSYGNEVRDIRCNRCQSLLYGINRSDILDYGKAEIKKVENI